MRDLTQSKTAKQRWCQKAAILLAIQQVLGSDVNPGLDTACFLLTVNKIPVMTTVRTTLAV